MTFFEDNWDIGVSGRWVDDFLWFVGPFQGLVESYTVFDLTGNYSFTPEWSIGLNVSNLFDNDHYEAFGGDLLGVRALGHIQYTWSSE